MVHPEDRHYVLFKLKECNEGNVVSDVECRIQQAKEEHWINITPHLINEDGQHLLIGIAEDITGYKANAEKLNNHNSKKKRDIEYIGTRPCRPHRHHSKYF